MISDGIWKGPFGDAAVIWRIIEPLFKINPHNNPQSDQGSKLFRISYISALRSINIAYRYHMGFCGISFF